MEGDVIDLYVYCIMCKSEELCHLKNGTDAEHYSLLTN